MKRIAECLLVGFCFLTLAACEVDYGDDGSGGDGGWSDGSGDVPPNACSTADETDIRGMENDLWTRMDPEGDIEQVYLQTIRNPSHFTNMQWVVGENRQTCSTGPVDRSYLQITLGDGGPANLMQVVPGLNYIDYKAYGCTPYDCDTLIESGTLVLDVDAQ